MALDNGFSSKQLNRIRKMILTNIDAILEAGMNIVASSEPRIVQFAVTDDAIVAQFADGRLITVPLAWSWRLANATPGQRHRFEIIGTGEGIHWPEIDEDISAQGLLSGRPAHPPKTQKPKRQRA